MPPCEGNKYASGIAKQRVLVLGESHWHSCDKDERCRNEAARDLHHRCLTIDVVTHWKDKPHSSPVSHRVPALFGMPKNDFWDRVVFYNYLQTFAGPRARDRPKSEQWNDPNSAKAFQTVLDYFEPNRILVLGKDTWTNLPSDPRTLIRAPIPEPGLRLQHGSGNRNAVDEVAYWYLSRYGTLALAMPIMHPSSPRFPSHNWASTIDPWMSFSFKPAQA